MAAGDRILADQRGIGEVLSRSRLVLPLNQREYAWQEEHIRDLLSDLANAIASRESTYFLGTIVLTTGEGDLPEVSDGQQRLATTTILLAAIRDYFHGQGDETRANAIENDYLLSTDLESTAIVPRLRMNVDDNEFFVKFVLSSPDSPDRSISPTKESHKRIQRAAELAAQHVQNVVEPFNESKMRNERLFEWINYLKSNAEVVVLTVPDHLNAYVMFETLNDRGLRASQADLIKNHLLSLARKRISEAQAKWASVTAVLESLDDDDMTVTFLHHYLITVDGPTKEREVFERIRSRVDSEARAIDFLDDLAISVNDYAALFNPEHSKWNSYGSDTRRYISTINHDLRVKQIRPLMFAVSRRFSADEARKAFRLFVIWSVRFLIVGGRGGLLDLNYSQQALNVGSGRVDTAEGIAAALSEVIPNDEAFRASFATQRVSQGYQARYYLRALELQRRGDPQPELIPSDDENTVNLEHVLPQSPEGNWPDISDELADVLWRRIGNMALLQAKKNSLVGNLPFTDKREVLAASAFLLTREIGDQEQWGEVEIDARQLKLADLAVRTWPIK